MEGRLPGWRQIFPWSGGKILFSPVSRKGPSDDTVISDKEKIPTKKELVYDEVSGGFLERDAEEEEGCVENHARTSIAPLRTKPSSRIGENGRGRGLRTGKEAQTNSPRGLKEGQSCGRKNKSGE